jgi:hypothetical protein
MGKGTSTNTIQKTDPWEGQQPYLKEAYAQAQNYMDTPQEFYPGILSAGLTDDQINAEANIRAIAQGRQQNISSQLDPAIGFQLGGTQSIANDPYLAGAVQGVTRPLYQQAQDLLQQTRRGATKAGQLGGSRQGIAESPVIRDYMNKAGDIGNQMYSTAYSDAAKRQLLALQQAPGTMRDITMPDTTLSSIGGLQQARIQQGIDEERQRFEFGQQEPLARLQNFSQVVNNSVIPGGTSSSVEGGEPSFGQKALGGAAVGLGTYGALSSGALGAGFAASTQAATAGSLSAGNAGASAYMNPWIAGTLALASLFG